MKVTRTPLKGLLVMEPQVFGDERGWFTESFNEQRFLEGVASAGFEPPPRFVQDNHSMSMRGVLRGLHYQLPPHAQGKLVRVTAGAAFDVAVDIRRSSPTFGKWFGLELSAANNLQLWIPAGFAHGFLALQDNTHFLYKTTDYYAKDCEAAIHWSDPSIDIGWPDLPVRFQVAPKDSQAPSLAAVPTSSFFE
ncbi:dTDP-4-dehydrorhamnose 3,5-epimerase [soil metagenome]